MGMDVTEQGPGPASSPPDAATVATAADTHAGPPKSDYAVLELMNDHYEGCRSEIVSLMQANERLLNLSILVVGGVFAYGISQEIYQLVAMAPIAIAIVMLQGLQRYQLVHQLGGYKRYLEEMMERECGRKVIFWEELCTNLYHKSWANYPIRALYSLAAILFVVEGYDALDQLLVQRKAASPGLWKALYGIGILIIAAGIFANFLRFKRSFNLAWVESHAMERRAASQRTTE